MPLYKSPIDFCFNAFCDHVSYTLFPDSLLDCFKVILAYEYLLMYIELRRQVVSVTYLYRMSKNTH